MPVSSNSKIVAPDAAHKTKSIMQSIVRIKGSSNFDGQSFGCSDRLIAHHIPLGESSGTAERLIPLGMLMVNERSYMSTQRWIRGGDFGCSVPTLGTKDSIASGAIQRDICAVYRARHTTVGS